MYKIDNKNQKAKIKNLEQRLDFQKYNIEEKKKKKKKEKRKEKKKQSHKNYQKTPPTTTQRLYMVFALKNRVFFFV